MTFQRDDDLEPRLRRLADAHQPDGAALWSRVEAGTRRTTSARSPRRAAVGRQRVWACGLAAAAVLGIALVSQSGRFGPDDGAQVTLATSTAVPADRTAAAGRADGPSGGPTAGPTGSPSSGSSVGATASGSGSAGPANTPFATATRPVGAIGTPAGATATAGRGPALPTTPAVPPAAGGPGVTTAPRPGATPAATTPPAPTAPAAATVGLDLLRDTTVQLSAPPLLDWIELGARSDGRTVRAKRPTSGQTVGVAVPGTAFRGLSPFDLSWVDGAPEQTHEGDTTMLAAPPLSAWTVTVPPSATARQLLLYVGGGGSLATVRVDSGSTWTSDALFLGVGYVITVDLPASETSRSVRVSSLSISRTPYFGIAAVALQRV